MTNAPAMPDLAKTVNAVGIRSSVWLGIRRITKHFRTIAKKMKIMLAQAACVCQSLGMKNTSKLDWQTSRIPTTGRVAAISDEGCGYWAALPETMTLQDAADAFGVGYDYNDYVGEISCNATLFVDGQKIESLDFTLDSTPEAE